MVDLDGDGLADLLRASGNRLDVLLQSADSRFESAASFEFARSGDIIDVEVGRFDGDRDLDVVVGLSAGADRLLVNDGAGRLSEPVLSPLPMNFLATRDVVVGNFDGQGPDDLLVLATNSPPVLLLATGMVTPFFVDRSTSIPSQARATREVGVAADVDGDGAVDLVLGGGVLSQPVVLFNSGTADFTRNPVVLPVAAAGVAKIAVGDINFDGALEIVIAFPGSRTQFPALLRNRGGRSFTNTAQQALSFEGVCDLTFASLDGDRTEDLLVVAGNGAVLVVTNLGAGGLASPRVVLGPARRCQVSSADVEADGDLDLFAPGFGVEDSLLLGAGDGSFRDVESTTVPFGLIGSFGVRTGVVVDLTGEGDPDLVDISAAGRLRVLAQRNGGVRFFESMATSVPTLPNLRYVDLAAGAISPSRPPTDLFALGQPTPAQPGGAVVLARNAQGAYVDVTRNIWGATFPSTRVLTTLGIVPRAGNASDVLIGDASGEVHLLRRVGAAPYAAVANAFGAVAGSAVQRLLVEDVNGDGRADVVVIRSSGVPQLFVSNGPTRYQLDATALPSIAPVSDGCLRDVDGDGIRDLLLVAPAMPLGFVYLRATIAGRFSDQTGVWFGALPVGTSSVRTVAVLESGASRSVVVGLGNGLTWLYHRSAGMASFGVPTRLPTTSALRTVRLSAADLDLDGDDDLVIYRDQAGPSVRFGADLQLAQIGTVAAGRTAYLELSATPGQTAFLLFGPAETRLPLAPFGILRLVNPIQLGAAVVPAGGVAQFSVPIPAGLPTRELALQGAAADFSTLALRLTNHEPLRVDRF